jgi:hypothetical protein
VCVIEREIEIQREMCERDRSERKERVMSVRGRVCERECVRERDRRVTGDTVSVTGAESKKEGDKECVNERERQTHRSDLKERE